MRFHALITDVYDVSLCKVGTVYRGSCPRCGCSGSSLSAVCFTVFSSNAYCFACNLSITPVKAAIEYLEKQDLKPSQANIQSVLDAYDIPSTMQHMAFEYAIKPLTIDDFPPLPEKPQAYLNEKGERRTYIGRETFVQAFMVIKNRKTAYKYWKKFHINEHTANQAWLGSNAIGLLIPYFMYAEEPAMDKKGKPYYQRRIVGGRIRCKPEYERPDMLKYWTMRRQDGITLKGIPYDPLGVLGSASGKRPGKAVRVIVLTEDEKSALTVLSLGIDESIYGVAMRPSNRWVPFYANLLGKAERVVLAYDNDPTGAGYARTMRHLLWNVGLQSSVLSIPGDAGIAAWAATTPSHEVAKAELLKALKV